jgi:hypothetical protein
LKNGDVEKFTPGLNMFVATILAVVLLYGTQNTLPSLRGTPPMNA